MDVSTGSVTDRDGIDDLFGGTAQVTVRCAAAGACCGGEPFVDLVNDYDNCGSCGDACDSGICRLCNASSERRS